MRVVVDANILFSALRTTNTKIRRVLFHPKLSVYAPNFLIVEIFKHKERILKKSRAKPDDVYEYLNRVCSRVHFMSETLISLGNAVAAHELCKDIDEKDTPYVALALEVEGRLWTRDDELKRGLLKKGFTQFFDESLFLDSNS